MNLTDNARVVLERRYLKKDDKGVCERPDDMIRRVADTIAAATSRWSSPASSAAWAPR